MSISRPVRHFVAKDERAPDHIHVLLITTGSVASVKAPLIVRELLKYENVKIEVISTKPSLTFFKREDIESQRVRVWTDDDEWSDSYQIGDPILHIELRRWADIVLVAPCSANTLAKISNGICDNLSTSLLRALAPTTPTYIFPAMNTLMYEHPLTAEHLRIIQDVVKYNVVGPIGKTLACGDIGLGAMTEWLDIVKIVVEEFRLVPPDHRITSSPEQIIRMLLPKLDRLQNSLLTVEHGQDGTSDGVMQLFRAVRSAMGEEANKLSKMYFLQRSLCKTVLQLVDASLHADTGVPTPLHFLIAQCKHAQILCKERQQSITTWAQSFHGTCTQIESFLRAKGSSAVDATAPDFTLTEENREIVASFFPLVDTLKQKLSEISEYYHRLQDCMEEMREKWDSGLPPRPSNTEVDYMSKTWKESQDSLTALGNTIAYVSSLMINDPALVRNEDGTLRAYADICRLSVVITTMTQENQNESAVPDEKFFFEDGSCIFKVKNRLFNLHRSILRKNSPFFDSMFSLPQKANAMGSSRESPIECDDSLEAFRALCEVLYSNPAEFKLGTDDESTIQKVTQIGMLAHKYQFGTIEFWASKTLDNTLSRTEYIDLIQAAFVFKVATECTWSKVVATIEAHFLNAIKVDTSFDSLSTGEFLAEVLAIAHGSHDFQARAYYAYLETVKWDMKTIEKDRKIPNERLTTEIITELPATFDSLGCLTSDQKLCLLQDYNTLSFLRRRLESPPAFPHGRKNGNQEGTCHPTIDAWWISKIGDFEGERGPKEVLRLMQCSSHKGMRLTPPCAANLQKQLTQLRETLSKQLPRYFGLT
ncbi:hypothetical protein NP233_g2070 [Leucocoprinus birnbaumii]|uniref:BTB domain-containing protein n=1 Tax=Leucocoprinus birnbaumii TaxID=56174 RepID=A0AAD5YZB2_9AGAR|nr:hypothetical protein NP233_g2070 [Leucocoprinus birnbaumii]